MMEQFVQNSPLQSATAKPANLSGTDLVRLAQQGDAKAFEELYRLHSRRVYAMCRRMTANSSEAEDLTQQVFLQVFRKIHTFRGDSAFSTWLHRLATNVVWMRWRKNKGIAETPLEDWDAGEDSRPRVREIPSLDPVLTGMIDRMVLRRAIAKLPRGYKRVFFLHDVYGYEHQEIAKVLDCTVGNSKSQLHKARMRLRTLLHEGNPKGARPKGLPRLLNVVDSARDFMSQTQPGGRAEWTFAD